MLVMKDKIHVGSLNHNITISTQMIGSSIG